MPDTATEYQWLMTVQHATPHGAATAWAEGTRTFPPGTTRHQAFEQLLAIVAERYQITGHHAVTFFSLEPNQL